MKIFTTTILSLFFWSYSVAQEINWFPMGAEWYFTPQCFFEPQCGVIRYHVEADTLIAGHTAVKIGSDVTLWGAIIDLLPFDTQYLRHENDTVFRYSFEADKWHFLYCVNPQPGDVWEIQNDEYLGIGDSYMTFVVEVDSIVIQEISGSSRRVVHTSPVGESDLVFYRPIIEGVGSTEVTAFIAASAVMLPAGYGPNFNCYLESGNLIYGSAAAPCGTVGVAEQNATQIMMFPNPANEQLRLQFVESTFPAETEFSLFDLTGRQHLQNTIPPGTTNYEVDIRHLAPGLYLLQCRTAMEVLWTGKVVKD